MPDTYKIELLPQQKDCQAKLLVLKSSAYLKKTKQSSGRETHMKQTLRETKGPLMHSYR